MTLSLFDPLKTELTIPPRFALTGGMPRTRITTELITYMLAKRSAELGRFVLLKHYSNVIKDGAY